MGTSCLLGIKKDNGKVDFSIVNFDGYLRGTGETLIYRLTPRSGLSGDDLKNRISSLIKEGYRSSLLLLELNNKETQSDDFAKGDGGCYEDHPVEDFLDYDRYDCEYAYLYDPASQSWSVASKHFPVVKKEYDDLRYVFGRDYDSSGYSTYCRYKVPYEQEKSILKNKVYDQFSKKFYPVEEMLAYELYHETLFHEKNEKYFKYVKGDHEAMAQYIKDEIFSEEILEKVKGLDERFEMERKAGLEVIKAEANKVLDEIENQDKANYERLQQNTSTFNLKETAKEVKKLLSINGFKNISVTTKYDYVDLKSDDSFTFHQVEAINKVLNVFNEAYTKYQEALNNYNQPDFNFNQKFNNYDFGRYTNKLEFSTDNIIEIPEPEEVSVQAPAAVEAEKSDLIYIEGPKREPTFTRYGTYNEEYGVWELSKTVIKDNKELHPLVKYKTCYATLDDVDGCKYLSNADKRELTETVSFNRNNSGKSYHR